MPTKPRRAVRWSIQALAWMVILLAVIVTTAAVLVPKLSGATTYRVLTGSMRPYLPPGTLVVVRPIEPQDVGVGDVITYQLYSGRPEVATHRVMSVAAGGKALLTKGDANDIRDPGWVRPRQLKGKVWYALPFLGRGGFNITDPRSPTRALVIVGLFGYAMYMFIGSMLARATKRCPHTPATGRG